MSAFVPHRSAANGCETADREQILTVWRQLAETRARGRDALEMLVSEARRLTDADGCAIALPDGGNSRVIKCQAGTGCAPHVGAALDVSSGLSGQCIRTGAPAICDDTAVDPRVDAAACRALNVKSALIVPIKQQGKVVGVVEAFAFHIAAFDAEHARVLEQIAAIAVAIPTLRDDRPVACAVPEFELGARSNERPFAPATGGEMSGESLRAGPSRESAVADVKNAADAHQKGQAIRLTLLSLAAVGAIAVAVGFYTMKHSTGLFNSNGVSQAGLTTTATAQTTLPKSDTAGDDSVFNRAATVRLPAATRPVAASPRFVQASSAESPNGNPAIVLPPPLPKSTGPATEDVSPPHLNFSVPKISDAALPPADLPTLREPETTQLPRPAAVSAHIDPARLLHKTDPVYPPAAFAARISGSVILQARIAADGRVDRVEILRGPMLFASAATNAVREWKYQPAQVDGHPVESVVVITINFSQ